MLLFNLKWKIFIFHFKSSNKIKIVYFFNSYKTVSLTTYHWIKSYIIIINNYYFSFSFHKFFSSIWIIASSLFKVMLFLLAKLKTSFKDNLFIYKDIRLFIYLSPNKLYEI